MNKSWCLKKKVSKINPTNIRLQENVSMEHAGILNHLTPRLQGLLSNAKTFKEGTIMHFVGPKTR